jgi:hypothetical protein
MQHVLTTERAAHNLLVEQVDQMVQQEPQDLSDLAEMQAMRIAMVNPVVVAVITVAAHRALEWQAVVVQAISVA